MNTGITIRTIHLRDGIARYGAGATLLYDSIPENEDRECHMKASNFFRALEAQPKPPEPYLPAPREGRGLRLLLVDNEDCFIHTLSNYARQTGAEVITYRAGFPLDLIDDMDPSLLLISSGPGRPSDFGLPDLVRHAVKREIPIFGVGLGLQGIVEAFGGELALLDYPVHGKPTLVCHWGMGVFEGLPAEFTVGSYYSLHALRAGLPSCLEITAETEDGIIMGIRHRELPIEAAQFHPDSILTLEESCGLRLVENAVLRLTTIKI